MYMSVPISQLISPPTPVNVDFLMLALGSVGIEVFSLHSLFLKKLLEDVLQQNKGANGERGKTGGPGNVTQHR